MNNPSTGDKVRYVGDSGVISDANVQAAFIDGPVNLRIIETNYDIYRISYGEDKSTNTWHWPNEE